MEIIFTFINSSMLWNMYMQCMYVWHAVLCITAFFVFTDMFMNFQKELLPYIFGLLDTCAINTYYMLNMADENSNHFKSNFKDLLISV
jgi:hypothetical protein